MYYSHFICSIGLLSLCNGYIVFGQHALPVHLQIQVGVNSGRTCIAREKRVNMKLETQPYSVSRFCQRELPVLPLTVSIPGQLVDI